MSSKERGKQSRPYQSRQSIRGQHHRGYSSRARGGSRNKHQSKPWAYNGNGNWSGKHWSNWQFVDDFYNKNYTFRPENTIYEPHQYEQESANDFYPFNIVESNKKPEDVPPLPGSEADRSKKIELDKKRIQEALSSATSTNQPINFKNSNIESGPREKLPITKNMNTPIQELRLTANDLMEIGSMEKKSPESNDLEDIGNNSNDTHIVQRFHNSFNITENVDQQSYKSSGYKSQSSGWKTFQIQTDFTEGNPDAQSTPKQGNTGREERILGNIVGSNETRIIESKVVNAHDSDRIGRLYQSFLKTRYFENKLKFSKDEPNKQKLQNPFLNTPIMHSQNLSNNNENQESLRRKSGRDQEEPEMPLPIKVKKEIMDLKFEQSKNENREELEADEFLKEFSHLLKPDLTIPGEILEQLGLGHLQENCLLTENNLNNHMADSNFNAHDLNDVPSKSERLLRVKSLSTLNSTPFIDNLPSEPSHTPRRNESINLLSAVHSTLRNSLSPISMSSLPSSSPRPNQSFHVHTENVNRATNTPTETTGLNVAHMNEYVENIISKTRIGSCSDISERCLNQSNGIPSLTDLEDTVSKRKTSHCTVNKDTFSGKQLTLKEIVENNRCDNINIQSDYSILNQPSTSTIESDTIRACPHVVGCSQNCESVSGLVDVSEKIVKMFQIDKQIQELMGEKIKLYSELMSVKEVASVFFNFWAKDIQGSPMTNQMEIPNTFIKSQAVPQASVNDDLNHSNQTDQSSMQNKTKPNTSRNRKRKSTTGVKNTKLKTLLTNVEAIKKYLVSVESNIIDNAVHVSQESLFEVKKEMVVGDEIPSPVLTGVSEETRLSDPELNIQCDSKIKPKTKKRKKKNPLLVDETKSGKKKQCLANELVQSHTENKPESNISCADNVIDIIEINSDEENEKFEHLYETKFELSNLKTIKKEEDCNELRNNNKKKEDMFQFSYQDVTIICMKISELQQVCVAGCRDGQLLIYSLTTGKLKGKLKGHEASITCISEYKGLVISGSLDSTLRCFHIKTKTELYCIKVGHQIQCMDLKYGLLFVGTKVGLLFTYTVKETLNLVDDPLNLTDSSILAVRAAKEGVRNILIVAARGEQITIRDASSGLLLRTFNWCDTIYCLEFAGESPIVYCGTRSKSVVAVNFISGEEKFKCNAGRGVSQICFAHDLMFTACFDGKIHIYDHKKSNLVTTVPISKGMLLSLLIYKSKFIVSTTRNEFTSIPFPQELQNYIDFKDKT